MKTFAPEIYLYFFVIDRISQCTQFAESKGKKIPDFYCSHNTKKKKNAYHLKALSMIDNSVGNRLVYTLGISRDISKNTLADSPV